MSHTTYINRDEIARDNAAIEACLEYIPQAVRGSQIHKLRPLRDLMTDAEKVDPNAPAQLKSDLRLLCIMVHRFGVKNAEHMDGFRNAVMGLQKLPIRDTESGLMRPLGADFTHADGIALMHLAADAYREYVRIAAINNGPGA